MRSAHIAKSGLHIFVVLVLFGCAAWLVLRLRVSRVVPPGSACSGQPEALAQIVNLFYSIFQFGLAREMRLQFAVACFPSAELAIAACTFNTRFSLPRVRTCRCGLRIGRNRADEPSGC